MKGHGLSGFHFVTKAIGIANHFIHRANGSRTSTIKCRDAKVLRRQYEVGAKRRKLVFELSVAQVGFLVSQCCFYCDADKTGIDRMNNKKGYTSNNAVPCCWVCNRMKGKLSVEHFVYRCRRIKERWENKLD